MATSRRTASAAASDAVSRAERTQGHFGQMAAKGTNAWLGTQAEMLREMDDVTRAFIQRRREAIQEAQRSLEEMQSCRDVIDAMKVQQRWLADSLQRLASEMGEIGVATLSLSQRALGGVIESGRAAGEEMNPQDFALSAAGAKPARGRRGEE